MAILNSYWKPFENKSDVCVNQIYVKGELKINTMLNKYFFLILNPNQGWELLVRVESTGNFLKHTNSKIISVMSQAELISRLRSIFTKEKGYNNTTTEKG